jgi:hypothetical protein
MVFCAAAWGESPLPPQKRTSDGLYVDDGAQDFPKDFPEHWQQNRTNGGGIGRYFRLQTDLA